MTYIILFLLGLIVYNLVAGFVYILKDKSASNRGFSLIKNQNNFISTAVLFSHNWILLKFDSTTFNLIYNQYTKTNNPNQTTSTKCQYQATASKPK